jgi:hypothetical protein
MKKVDCKKIQICLKTFVLAFLTAVPSHTRFNNIFLKNPIKFRKIVRIKGNLTERGYEEGRLKKSIRI